MDEKLRPGRTGAVPIRPVNAVQRSSCFDVSPPPALYQDPTGSNICIAVCYRSSVSRDSYQNFCSRVPSSSVTAIHVRRV